MRLCNCALVFWFLAASPVYGWTAVFPLDELGMLGHRHSAVLETGETVLTLAGPFENPQILLIDANGQLLWRRTFLGKADASRAFESGGFLVPMEGGFAAAFNSEPRATGVDTDVAVLRIDTDGELVWTYLLGEEDSLTWMCSGLIGTADGGLLLIGSPSTMLPGGYALRLDSHGVPVWDAPVKMDYFPLSVIETGDGGYLCLLLDTGSDEVPLQPISPEGAVLPEVRIPGDGIRPRVLHTDGGSIWLTSIPTGFSFHSLRLSPSLEVEASVTGVFPVETGIRRMEIDSFGFLVAGEFLDDAFMARADYQGRIVATERVPAGESCIFQSISRAGEMTVATGTVFRDGSGDSLIVHLMKLGAD